MSRLFLLRATCLLHWGVARSEVFMLWTVNAAMSTPRHATELLRTRAEVDRDMAVDIEHEDAAYDRLEGLALAAENLRAAAAKL